MKTQTGLLALVFFCFTTVILETNAAQDEDSDDGPFRNTRNVEFDWKVTQQIFAGKSNVIFSPFQVKLMLALMYDATGIGEISREDNQLKRELRLVLEPNGSLRDTRLKYRQFLDSLLRTNRLYDVQFGTKFFVNEFIDVALKYELILDHFYNASTANVPFSKPQKVAEVINSWARSTSKGSIDNLITVDDVADSTTTLASFASLKGLWRYPFVQSNTRKGSFKEVKVDYMKQNAQFYYDDSAVLGAQLLRMPFQGGKFAMYFMLPHQGQSVDDVLSRVTPQSLHQALWYMDESDVNVTIPKFRFDFSMEIIKPLHDIGVRSISNASLPLLARGKGARNQVRVSRIFQKSAINLDEMGTGTNIVTKEPIVDQFENGDETQIFYANRPFLFYIEDEHTGAMILAGKVEDPTK